MSKQRSEAPYIELLSLAYEVPLQNRDFEHFLDSAHDFFSVDLESGEIDTYVVKNVAAQSELDGHTDRLSQIFDMALEAELKKADISDVNHAVLSINASSFQVTGNAAAKSLFRMNFPAKLEDLALDPNALKALKNSVFNGHSSERIILATIGQDVGGSYLGLVQRPRNESEEIHVSFSFLSWSGRLLARLGEAIGLTPAETEILGGYLRNDSTKQIADERHRSLETIKVQSKSILRKAGCSKMSDVLQLSAGIAYMLRQMPDEEGLVVRHREWETPRDEMHALTRAGRSVAYYKHGAGRQVILFSHALIQGPFFHPEFLAHLAQNDVTLLAPSRPGYGYTDAPEKDQTFEQDAVADALAVLERYQLGNVHVVAQQLGTSHAVRIVNALGKRAKSLILINGGVPPSDTHYAGMDRRVRFAALSARHAPSVLRLANALGIRSFKKKGAEQFLLDRYSSSQIDMKALANQQVRDLHLLGLYHACQQGSSPFFWDELSKHADWSVDLLRVTCPQFWLQPEHCRIVSADKVQDVVGEIHGATFVVEPDSGSILMYERPTRVAQFILDSMTKSATHQ